jgi:MFS transporter, PAT family, beta-lactamase induction signal transducer AmpG
MTQAVKDDAAAPASAPPPAPLSTALQQAWWRSLVWVPTLYLAMGIPYNVINGTALRMYKSLGYTDSQITVALGSIGVAWSLKPFWAAFLDMYRTKKFFVLATELLIAVLFMGVAMTLPLPGFFQISIALFWVAAFASSTQDICADGIYLTSLDESSQSRLAGVQGMFWVLGKVLATGLLISVLDKQRVSQGWDANTMWRTVMLTSGGALLVLAAYHFVVLPTGSLARRPENTSQVWRDFVGTAKTFFHKRMFWGMLAFVFLYRLGEGLILMEGQLFLQSEVAKGGLGLTAGQVSDIDAVYGTIASIIGGLLGGMFLSKMTLPKALGVLGLCLNIPHFTYVYLSQAAVGHHGVDYSTIVTMVSIEKFGYGFGFVGNMVYMMQQLAPGRSTMTHYAFATALMNLMLVPTSMVSGPLAESLGFSTFFLVVMFASIPSAWAAFKAPFPIQVSETQKIQAPGASGQDVITVDDPSRLTDEQREVQRLAGRASLFATLAILTVLVVDARLLGDLQQAKAGDGAIPGYFAGIIVALGLKAFLGQRTFQAAKEATERAARIGDTVYVGNAKGAKIGASLALFGSLAVLYVAIRLAF